MNSSEFYPKLKRADADYILRLYSEGKDVSKIVLEKTSGEFEDKSKLNIVVETLFRLVELAEITNLNLTKNAQEFHYKASIELHKNLKSLGSATRDTDFWRWLTFCEQCDGASLVDLRYSKNGPGKAKSEYYLGNNNRNFLCSLWLRACHSFQEENKDDPYYLTGAELDIDFWWSHVVRISHPACWNMHRAFVKFIVDKNIKRGSDKELEPYGYRNLASELTRRFATISFEMMDEDAAYKFIEQVWAEREIWKKLVLGIQ